MSNSIKGFYKVNETDKIWWYYDDTMTQAFSFDQKTLFYLPRDYWKMTPEQKKIFDKENPFWKEFCGG